MQRNWIKWLIALIFIVGINGCTSMNFSGNKTEPLPTVAPLNTPKLPDWIEEISPTGTAEPLAQIRIRFKQPLIPLESLDSTQQQDKLKHFEILPEIPGKFRFLTPQMVGFQAEKALPKATRIQVKIKAGLEDLQQQKLPQDIAWTFNTEPIKITNLPQIQPSKDAPPEYIDIKPNLTFTSNVELNLDSLKQKTQLIPEGKQEGIGVNAELKNPNQQNKNGDPPANNETPEEKFNPAVKEWKYTITPQKTLEKATKYTLKIAPGLQPLQGNLPSESTFISQVATYAPLTFEKLKSYGEPDSAGSYGRFIKGSPQLQFNNGLIAESAINNIQIKPAAKQPPKLVQAYDKETVVNLNPWSLEPATNYTIEIGANLKDQFGQTLGKPITIKYQTSDLAAEIWAPDRLNIFPPNKNLQLNISAVNLSEGKYKAAYRNIQPTDLVYNDSAYPRGEGNDLLPPTQNWQTFKVSGKKNQVKEITIPLEEKLGSSTGMLAYGVQAKTNSYQEKGQEKWREPSFYGMVQLTNLGVFSQIFPDMGIVRVHHLTDGVPVAGASVEIYPSKLEAKSQTPVQPCATGKTDKTGTLVLNSPNFQQCLKTENPSDAPALLVIAKENKDWAFTRNYSYSGAYGYGIENSQWDSGKLISRGTIFSDRELYQPGEKVQATGIAYYLQNDTLKADKNTRYTLTLQSPDNKKTDLGVQSTNEFATFSLEIPLATNQPLGYYSILAKGTNGLEFSGKFRVAEFKPPNFKVSLNLDKKLAQTDEKIEAKASSSYLFGAPVEGGKAQYYITRQKTEFIPKGWDKFSFGRNWFWPEEAPTISSDVLQQNTVLDTEGKSSQTFTVAKDLPYPMTYRVDVEVSDVSNLSVADSQSFIALPSNRLIGLQTDFVAEANKGFPIQVIVTDPNGNILEGETVRLELQQMKYSSVTQVVEGGQTDKNQVEYKTVAKTEIKSSKTAQTVSMTAPDAGSYRIRANLANAKDETSATDLQIWITGDSAVNWGRREGRDNALQIKLDKDTYQPGETATALIQSPYPEAELYFAVVRNKPLYQTITKVKGGAPQIQFKVTPEMLPNAAVEAVLVRQGTPLNQLEPGSVENLAQIGFAPFKTNLDSKYLQLQINPEKAELEPGNQQTIQLQLKDNQGKPASGQFTVMVVNEAVLQLSGYRPPDLVKTVYAEQSISTRFSDNRSEVVLQPLSSPLQKGWGYGGGFSAGNANTRIRQDFQPLAYYNPAVITDKNGRAKISFKLPDNLTTWRVMAVAASTDMRFGNSDTTFITTKSLISNPLLPQFARKGDKIEAGLSVTNPTKQTGNLAINSEVTGAVKFENNQNRQTLRTKAETGTRAYRFPMIAINPGKSQVRFVTQLNNNSDAFEIPLEVKPLEVTEQVVQTGTTEKTVKIPLNVNQKVVRDAGGLEIFIASTLIPEITAPAKQILQDDTLPFLEPIASQLTIAANLQILSQKYGQTLADFKPKQQAAQAIEKLQKLALPDGGFGSTPTDKKSDPFLTPYAAQSLARAKAAGMAVSADTLTDVTAYLKNILANPGDYEFCQAICKNQLRLLALISLADLGEKRNDFLADIYAVRDEFDAVTQLKLVRYLSQFPEWQTQAKTLWEQLRETTYQTGRTATVNLPQSWKWLSSATTAQAQTLRLAIAQNSKPEQIDRLLEALLSLRQNGNWGNSYDTAEALTALVEYSQLQPTPPNFKTVVKVGNKKLDSIQFKGYQNPSQFINVAMDSLNQNATDVTLEKSGTGTLHYLVNYSYRLQGNQPGRFNGLRISREIQPANQDKTLQKIGLNSPDKPLTLQTGQVFDIGLEIITDQPANHLIITDALPAGLEPIDSSFKTSTAAIKSQANSWQINYQNIHRDRIIAYANRLEPGIYNLHYLVRSVTPGNFYWPGAETHLEYAPEEFGRSASSTLEIKQ